MYNIFLTFILDWYNPDAVFEYIYDEHDKDIFIFYKESIIIYIAFLISSCLEKKMLIVSFIIMFIFINISIYRNYKFKNKNNILYSKINLSKNNEISNIINNLFNFKNIKNNFKKIKKKEYKKLYLSLILENLMKILYVIILIIGFIYNFIETKNKYKKNFKFYKFIFSIRKCKK